ncbi:MAG TPA: 1,2-phenylacetyl-CoA epoxidase subunit PaaD [Candidatus Limnocylindrales bacterium]|nr:1,2-phenylacetyl-CoA epoxidase subunit PaaD [Candidatus Limnocylindrales bacterium]
MSEAGTHASIARARSGGAHAGPSTPVTDSAVRAALAEVPDPELPVLSVVDLGIIHRVTVAPDAIDVTILPTFVGCPALDVIRATIVDHLAERFGRPVRVETTFEVPWTSDRISLEGRAALASIGIAPPTDGPAAMRCPFCASANVAMDSAFGPTQCRSLYYCRACRQPFEALKSV